MASAAAKPCQGDSLEFYLITGRIPDDLQHSFRNSDACYHDPEKYEHAGLKVTTYRVQEDQRMEESKITAEVPNVHELELGIRIVLFRGDITPRGRLF
ncbi:hypothetical protein Tco_0314072 [Tanacetum coccineum]